MGERARVGIVGASGYTGAELIRLLAGHAQVSVVLLCAQKAAGQRLEAVFPHLAPLVAHGSVPELVSAVDVTALAALDAVFLALPHGESAPLANELLTRAEAAGHALTVIDLSADFRLQSLPRWRAFYGSAEHPEHPAPQRLAEARYGLVEHARAGLGGARLIAVPGCYPTAALLSLWPLLAKRQISPRSIIIDAKSGVSGAGRQASATTHFSEVGEGLRPYAVGGVHRHTAEIEEQLSLAAGEEVSVLFTPHLVPMSRGIVSCAYADARGGFTSEQLQATLEAAYAREPFVHVLPLGGPLPDTSAVRGSNVATLAVRLHAGTGKVLAMAAIDNLVKGAAGQAVQALNAAMGWPETMGLTGGALFP